MEILTSVIDSIAGVVWGPPMIIVLLGTHLYLTFRTKGIQRKLFSAIKMSFKKDNEHEGDISQFAALCMTLSGTIGTGNIIGVGTAILAGGPGAVLWMWLTGVFGIATKYVEVFSACKYREKDDRGNIVGGAMVTFKRAFNRADGTTPLWAKAGSSLFAIFTAFATLGIGCAVQSQAISGVVTDNFSEIPPIAIAIVLAIMTALVIMGGIKSISTVCEKLVPFMAVAYAGGSIIILLMNIDTLGQAIQMICIAAFTPSAAFGGALGSSLVVVMQYGCARGLFSNESGLGSAPIISATASGANPARLSLVAMTGTFWSTVVMCLLSGLVIVTSMIKHPYIVDSIVSGDIIAGATLTNAAFATIPYIGTPLLMLGILTFALSTIFGWYYNGDRCMAYLFGTKSIRPYQVVYVIACFFGAVGIGDVIWSMSDIANALMAIPNCICILLLSGLVARETKHYVWDDNLDEIDGRVIPMKDE